LAFAETVRNYQSTRDDIAMRCDRAWQEGPCFSGRREGGRDMETSRFFYFLTDVSPARYPRGTYTLIVCSARWLE